MSLAYNCLRIPAVIFWMWILVSHARQMRPVRRSSDLGKGSCRDTQGTQPQRAQNSHWLCFFGVSLQQWHCTSLSGRFYLPAKAWGSLRSNIGSIWKNRTLMPVWGIIMLAEPSKSESSFFFRDAALEILTDLPSIFLSDLPSGPSSLLLKGLGLLESGRVMTD
jgi:hypothetical protein